MKGFLPYALIAILAIGIIGCGAKKDDTAAETDSAATTAGNVPTTPPDKTNAKPGPSTVTAAPAGSANDSRWAAGTALKGGK